MGGSVDVAKFVVEEKGKRSDGPGDGVADHDGLDGAVDLGNNCKPDDAQDADSKDGNQRWHERFSRAAYGAGENFNEDVGEVERHNAVEHFYTNVYDVFVGDKQHEAVAREGKIDGLKD